MRKPTTLDRLAQLEREMAELKEAYHARRTPWLDRIYGAFENNQDFLEAMELGRLYRQSSKAKPAKKSKSA